VEGGQRDSAKRQGVSIPQVSEERSLTEESSGPIVLLWDHRGPRRQRLCHLISDCKARPYVLDEFRGPSTPDCPPGCRLALVAVGSPPAPGCLVLHVLQQLKRQRVTILCYEDGVQAWPLGVRCQVLLAGAARVFDSAGEASTGSSAAQSTTCSTRRRGGAKRIDGSPQR
jgi:hypothetical protein